MNLYELKSRVDEIVKRSTGTRPLEFDDIDLLIVYIDALEYQLSRLNVLSEDLLPATREIVRVHKLPGQAAADQAAWERLENAIKKVDGER